MLHKLIIKDTTALEDAIRLLDLNGNGFLPVVDEEGKLFGIFTDGDLRKGLLKNQHNIHELINRNPIIALNTESRSSVIQRLYSLKRRHMPIVDKEGCFIDVVVLNDFNEKFIENKVIIMAGGLGTRLGDLTKDVPKPMLRINGKPILHKIVEGFRDNGFHNFIFCLNYKSDLIINYFGDGKGIGVSIDYTIEDKRLGTAGALSLIDSVKLDKPFIVTNGDIITALNFEDFLDAHIKGNATATIAVKRFSYQLPYANIIFDEENNMVSLEEKPTIPFFVNAGIYVFNPLVLEWIPYNTFFDMPSLILKLKNLKKEIKTFKMDDYWIDIGSPKDLRNAGL